MDPSNSLTFCVRLNYKRLGEKSYVFFVESAQEGGEPFLWVKANYPNSWFGFGNFETSMAYSNWILNDPINEEFRLDQYLISEVILLIDAFCNLNYSFFLTLIFPPDKMYCLLK